MTNDAQWPICLPLSDFYREEIINYMQDEEHPDGPDDRGHYVRADHAHAELKAAVAAEREACARILETWEEPQHGGFLAQVLRERGGNPKSSPGAGETGNHRR